MPVGQRGETLSTLGFGLALELQNVRAQLVEPLFDGDAEQRVLAWRPRRYNLGPILRQQGLPRGREEDAIFHQDVAALVRQEFADDGVDVGAQHLLIGEHDVDGLRDVAQALAALAVLAGEIADFRRRRRIADFSRAKTWSSCGW